jgi:hypothetical protein
MPKIYNVRGTLEPSRLNSSLVDPTRHDNCSWARLKKSSHLRSRMPFRKVVHVPYGFDACG